MVNSKIKTAFSGFRRVVPAGWLQVTGEDAASFLQGQCSQDLAALAVGRCAYGLWLTQKGRVEADSLVLRTGEREFWLFSEGVAGAVLQERLERFIIADDVAVADGTNAVEACWRVWGSEAEPAVGSGGAGALAVGEVCAVNGGWWARDPRAGGGRCLWVGPLGRLPAELGCLEVSEGQWEAARIEAGVIRVPQDIGPGELPNEGGLDRDAISYSKGCYLGQETVARLRAMGQVRRRLHRVRGAGAPPGPEVKNLFQGGRRVGELRSRVTSGSDGFVGYALLTLLQLDPARGLALDETGPEVLQIEAAT